MYRIKHGGCGGAWGPDGHPIDCKTLGEALKLVYQRFEDEEINHPYAPIVSTAELAITRCADGKLVFHVIEYTCDDTGLGPDEIDFEYEHVTARRRCFTEIYDYTDYQQLHETKTFMRGRKGNPEKENY
ncbi:MAG: hypothetical protein WC455_11800 [Dehalococcoidia bacterium]|jgi:hypothetical protein